jgi:2-polyprenyl-3-methyl-5-hydroxy-6-metoxy-1,4-benzoquinol methylase
MPEAAADARYALQDEQYRFPYHYLPEVRPGGEVAVSQVMDWGVEYLTYMTWARDTVAALAPRRVLDVGCGDARLLHMLRGMVPERVGVDPSGRAIAFARAFNPDCAFHEGLVGEVEGAFDVVTCVETLEHVPDEVIPGFAADLARRVRPGGHLVVTVPSVARPVHRKHHRHYTPELLERQLGGGFALREMHHLFVVSGPAELARRLVSNRLWTVNAAPVRRWLWRRVQAAHLHAPAGRGAHLGAVFQRVGAEGP